jgi:hypothetical protein
MFDTFLVKTLFKKGIASGPDISIGFSGTSKITAFV